MQKSWGSPIVISIIQANCPGSKSEARCLYFFYSSDPQRTVLHKPSQYSKLRKTRDDLEKVMFPAWLCSRSTVFGVPEHLLSSQLRLTILISPFLILREILGQCHILFTLQPSPDFLDFLFSLLPRKRLVVISKDG